MGDYAFSTNPTHKSYLSGIGDYAYSIITRENIRILEKVRYLMIL